MESVYSVAVSARATLNLHSLNNEGGEGNQIQTRMVNVVGTDGRMHNVNAISGDMWKHIQAEHYFRLAVDRGSVPLCAGCRQFDANRISADPDYTKRIGEGDVSDAQALTWLLETCAMDDVEGNLVTVGGRSLPRKSVVEFGWVVGVPEQTTTDTYFHAKYARGRSEAEREAVEDEQVRKGNLGQSIFHRPASSGVYAIVAHLETARIGFNDIEQVYPVSEDDREHRYRLLIESLCYALLEPNGAMRNTQAPHILGIQGIVACSAGPLPAPSVSPLHEGFREQIAEIAANLEPLSNGGLELHPFDDLAEWTSIMAELATESRPYAFRL